MIKTLVTSIGGARDFIKNKKYGYDKIAVISITMTPLEFDTGDIPHLLIRKEDVDEKWKQVSIDHYGGLFNQMDALAVKAFVESNIDDVDYFLIHCDAGVSRSRAVAAALEFVYNGNDGEHFDKGVPNRTVYREVLEAFGYSNDYTEKPKIPCYVCGETGGKGWNMWMGKVYHSACERDFEEELIRDGRHPFKKTMAELDEKEETIIVKMGI
jgi:hypothetical protein